MFSRNDSILGRNALICSQHYDCTLDDLLLGCLNTDFMVRHSYALLSGQTLRTAQFCMSAYCYVTVCSSCRLILLSPELNFALSLMHLVVLNVFLFQLHLICFCVHMVV